MQRKNSLSQLSFYHDSGTRYEMMDIRVWTSSSMNAVGGVFRINEYQAMLSMNSECKV